MLIATVLIAARCRHCRLKRLWEDWLHGSGCQHYTKQRLKTSPAKIRASPRPSCASGRLRLRPRLRNRMPSAGTGFSSFYSFVASNVQGLGLGSLGPSPAPRNLDKPARHTPAPWPPGESLPQQSMEGRGRRRPQKNCRRQETEPGPRPPRSEKGVPSALHKKRCDWQHLHLGMHCFTLTGQTIGP